MTEALVVALLACGALAYVLRVRRDPSPAVEPNRSAEEASARKRAALIAIVDLEIEREVGKLSDDDFAVLRAENEAEALAALRELDALRDSSIEDDELEEEIAAVRERLRCPECGAARRPGQRCSRCGA